MPYAKSPTAKRNGRPVLQSGGPLGLCQNCNNPATGARCDVCKVRYGRKPAKPAA